MRWADGAGALLARFAGAAPRPQAELAERLLREAGLETEIVDEDDELWSEQRERQRASGPEGAGACASPPCRRGSRTLIAGRRGRRRLARRARRPRALAGCGSRRRSAEQVESLRRIAAARPPASSSTGRPRSRSTRGARSTRALLALMRRVKEHFDPAGMLQPRRVRGRPVSGYDDTRAPQLELIDDCVHCGFCLPTCPTYTLWGEEMDSPRGRIVLMKEGHEAISPPLVEHLDRCLGCMACVTACPSGVQYDKLLEDARAQVERNFERPPAERAHRRLVFELFTRPGRLRASAPGLAATRALGLDAHRQAPARAEAAAEAGRADGARARHAAARARSQRLPERFEARGERRGTVALLQGCVQRVFFGHVNEATARVLAAEGFEVHAPRRPRCCGALPLHAGADPEARSLAKDTIEELEGYDTVIVNAAGCGSAMKDYGHVLRDEPDWAERAEAFSAKVRDVTEFLAEVGAARRAPAGRA